MFDNLHLINQALSELEDAIGELEELNECGDLEDRLEKAYEIDEMERQLLKLRCQTKK